MELRDLIANFITSREQGLSGARHPSRPSTIGAYIEDLNHFLTFMEARDTTDFTKIKTPDFASFRLWLQKKDWSPASRNKVYRSLRALSYFVQKDALCQDLELKPFRQQLPSIPKAPPRKNIPEPAAVKLFLMGVNPNSRYGRRTLAMLMLLCDTGMRIGELIGIRVQDVKLDQKHIIVDGKTGPRVVYITAETARLLVRLMKERSHAKCDRLFVARGGLELDTHACYLVFKKLSVKTGVKIHPHLLRHYYCTQYLKNGGSLDKLAETTGHKSLDQLKDYTHLAGDPKIQHELERVSPAKKLSKGTQFEEMRKKYARAAQR